MDIEYVCDVPLEIYRYIKYDIQIDLICIYIYMDYVGYLSQDYHHNPVSSIILKERTIRNSRRFQTVEDDSDMF